MSPLRHLVIPTGPRSPWIRGRYPLLVLGDWALSTATLTRYAVLSGHDSSTVVAPIFLGLAPFQAGGHYKISDLRFSKSADGEPENRTQEGQSSSLAVSRSRCPSHRLKDFKSQRVGSLPKWLGLMLGSALDHPPLIATTHSRWAEDPYRPLTLGAQLRDTFVMTLPPAFASRLLSPSARGIVC